MQSNQIGENQSGFFLAARNESMFATNPLAKYEKKIFTCLIF
jgi:hypothetical protein